MGKGRDTTDQELVWLAKKGDSRAFGDLMLRYQNRIYRLASRMTKIDEDAEDVLQEAFVKAYRGLSGFDGRSKFSTWLYRITVNCALMRLRRKALDYVSLDEPVVTRNGSVPRDLEDASASPLDRLIGVENAEILDRAIADLTPNSRAVFVLRHVEGLSTEETAKILKISAAAVKSRLHRTRTELRRSLLRYMPQRPDQR